MDVFSFHKKLVKDYQSYIESFIRIRDEQIKAYVDHELDGGLLWPEPLIQLNPSFEPGCSIEQLSDEGILHDECRRIFRIKPEPGSIGKEMRLHKHQEEVIRTARAHVGTARMGRN